MRLKSTALGVMVAAALILASCGGAEETTSTTAPSTETTGPTQTTAAPDSGTTTTAAVTDTTTEADGPAGDEGLAIRAGDDFRFEPDTILMSAGQQVELTFRNTGSVQHSLAVLKADAELEHVLGETDEVHRDEELHFEIHEQDGGASVTETFTAPSEPGEYVIACLVPGHATAGMVGKLVVD